MKVPKLLSQYLCIITPIVIVCFILSISGKVSLDTHSFAVDSTGKLYIGKDSKIEVYWDRSLLFTILNAPRGFFFTIKDDDTILLSDGSTVYIMDLFGNILSQSEDHNGETQTKLVNKKTFISRNGEKYLKRSNWGRVEIVHVVGNREIIIYKMPLLDYIMLILLWSMGISGLILFPIILIQWKKMTK